jgi:hypothetical protein
MLDEVAQLKEGESIRVYGMLKETFGEEGRLAVVLEELKICVEVDVGLCPNEPLQKGIVYMAIGEVEAGKIKARVFKRMPGFDMDLYKRTIRVWRTFLQAQNQS